MCLIGFELLTERSVRILPNSSFSISILWNGVKIAASVGKDRYNQHSFILPYRRITATGRFHHSTDKLSFLQKTSFQVSPCRLVKCPSVPLEDLKLAINLPQRDTLEPLYRNCSLRFCKKNEDEFTKYTLYLDPRSVEEHSINQYQINLSHLIPRHFKHFNH